MPPKKKLKMQENETNSTENSLNAKEEQKNNQVVDLSKELNNGKSGFIITTTSFNTSPPIIIPDSPPSFSRSSISISLEKKEEKKEKEEEEKGKKKYESSLPEGLEQLISSSFYEQTLISTLEKLEMGHLIETLGIFHSLLRTNLNEN